jgi:ribose transport system substrate-binding protein
LTEKYGSAKGNAVTLQGTQGATATIGRQNGFLKAIEGTDIKIIADQPAEFVLADAQAAMENILQAHGDEIDVVFCHSDEMALGAIQAIEAYGLIPGKDIIIGGVDGQGTAFEDIKNGRQNVTITCDPFYGDTVFGAIATLETGGTIPAWVIKEGQLIDSTNVEEFWDLQF